MDDNELENNKGLSGLFRQFAKPFWVVNAFELFERGAYYGTMSVLGVHVTYYLLENDPTAAAVWGILYAMLIVLLYFIPLFSAALAEKYGYRRVLFVCYGLMMIGYFSLSSVRPGQFGFLIFSFFMIGVGAGSFKPIISATIAHVTHEKQRNLAYSIYYWMINLGATVVPFSIGMYTLVTFGVSDEQVLAGMGIYYFVGILSGVLVIINTLILIFLFRNPILPNKELSITHAFKRIVPAFRDKKFVVLLAIYSGFWFMFAYNHTFLPVLMVDFGRMPNWFQLAFLATINPGTIIILGPFLGKLVEKYKSLNVMMTGIVIFCLGLAINGFSNTPALFVIGIIVFSIGEFITHPGFISYVSKIAPKDKVTIYMGSIFISTGLGNAIGGIVHGFWYNYFARALFMPQVYVSLVIAVGLLTLVCFILYNQWMIRETLLARPMEKVDTGIWTKTITAGVALLFIPIAISTAFLGGPNQFFGTDDDQDVVLDWNADYDRITDTHRTEAGYSDENTEDDITITFSEDNFKNLISVTFELNWVDEADASIRHNNQADSFSISVTTPEPNNQTLTSAESSSGSIVLAYDVLGSNIPKTDPYFNGTGNYIVTIQCGTCGDHELRRPSLGIQDVVDDGNNWELQVKYTYYLKRNQ